MWIQLIIPPVIRRKTKQLFSLQGLLLIMTWSLSTKVLFILIIIRINSISLPTAFVLWRIILLYTIVWI